MPKPIHILLEICPQQNLTTDQLLASIKSILILSTPTLTICTRITEDAAIAAVHITHNNEQLEELSYGIHSTKLQRTV